MRDAKTSLGELPSDIKPVSEADKAIAKNIIIKMRAYGWSQIELAEKAGISAVHLSKVLRLRTPAGRNFLEYVSLALNCSIQDLYATEYQYVKPSPTLATIIQLLLMFSEATEETRGMVFELLKRS